MPESEALTTAYVVVAALAAAVVAFKSFGYVRDNLRRRGEDPPPGPGGNPDV